MEKMHGGIRYQKQIMQKVYLYTNPIRKQIKTNQIFWRIMNNKSGKFHVSELF